VRDAIMLKLPGFRHFIRERLLARFARIFSIMIESGVSLDESLQAAHETTSNEVMKNAIEHVRQEVREGSRMTPPLEEANVFPPLAVDLVAVGEEAGALGRVFERIADVYEEKIETDVAIVGKFIQPFIVITLGLMVLFIIISFLGTYLALFSQVTTKMT
jgi:type IV pilus assembly protein PilC